MKKQNAVLQLHIPKPCDQKWANMTPVKGGRFCHQCDRHIVDFTRFTDTQILAYYKKHEGKICGMFRPNQLDRDIQQPVPPRKFQTWKKVAAVSAGLMISQVTMAQQSPTSTTTVIEQQRQSKQKTPLLTTAEKTLRGIVVDEATNEPLIYATILVLETNTGTHTDLDGNFKLVLPDSIMTPTIEVSYTGYQTTELPDLNLSHHHTITMKEGVQLEEIVITGYAVSAVQMGALSVVSSEKKHRSTPPLQLKSIDQSTSPVYPNPFTQTFSIKLDIEVADIYIANIYNVTGRLVYAKTIDLLEGKQVITLDQLPAHLTSGSYILQVVRENEVILTEKVSKIK
ncbi:MAG: carboxypeptidase-like regulatory domain-containing protein [Bacteroidota bacterium]